MKFYLREILITILPMNLNMCFVCSLLGGNLKKTFDVREVST